MNRLLLLRHAKALPAPDDGEDFERPLAERGVTAVRSVGGVMVARGLVPNLALCSTAVRTRQTLAALVPLFPKPPRILYEDGLYLTAAPRLLARLRHAGTATSVLLVGHNPGLHELAVMLAGEATGKPARKLRQSLPTAGLAAFEIDDSWADFDPEAARLVSFITPKELADA